MGVPFAAGIRRLVDSNQQFFRASLASGIFYRTRNFDTTKAGYATLGFSVSATGNQAGTTDTQILPPPSVRELSLHNIGLNSAKLRFGAQEFIVSHTFVRKILAVHPTFTELQVWEDKSVVGIVYDGRLYSIENITRTSISGETITWHLVCNLNTS